MNRLRKTALALVAVIALVGSSFAGQVTVGGNIPLINSIIGIGVLSLDFGSAGSAVTVATFIVNNNAPEYSVNWVFTNLGVFTSADGGKIDMNEIFLTSVNNTGDLGTGADPILNGTDYESGTKVDPAAAHTWVAATNESPQTTATKNYMIEMRASWDESTDALAGLYTETITYTIEATL